MKARAPLPDSYLRSRLVDAVNSTNLSHAEIARRSGVNRSTVSNVLNGRREGLFQTWDAILKGLDIKIGWKL